MAGSVVDDIRDEYQSGAVKTNQCDWQSSETNCPITNENTLMCCVFRLDGMLPNVFRAEGQHFNGSSKSHSE